MLCTFMYSKKYRCLEGSRMGMSTGVRNVDPPDQSDGGWVDSEDKGQSINEVIGVKKVIQ